MMKRRATFLPAPTTRGRQAALIIVGTVLAIELGALVLLMAGAPW